MLAQNPEPVKTSPWPTKILVVVFLVSLLALIVLLGGPSFLKAPVRPGNSIVKTSPTKIFGGRVVRVLTKNENFILEVMDAEATSAANRVTMSFIVKKIVQSSPSGSVATESASKNNYTTEFGNIGLGDTLKVTYSGDKAPYKVFFVQNTTDKNTASRPAFMHGFVTVVSGDSLKMYSTDGGDYTLMIDGTVLLGPMYQKVGKLERPGKLDPVKNFSELKVGQEVSVFYTRNFGEIIIPESIRTL